MSELPSSAAILHEGEPDPFQGRHRSLWQHTLWRLTHHKPAILSGVFVILLTLLAIFAPRVAPFDPVEMHPTDAFRGPSTQYLLGTDEYGRDLFSRIIFGSRASLAVGIISVSISLVVGTSLGLLSGYYLGIPDVIICRAMDILYAFPPLLLALVVAVILGTGMDKASIAIGITFAPLFAKVCRGSVLAERGKAYVEAARTVGASDFRIMRQHILPNVLAPIIVQASLCMSYAILIEAGLSYLGLGTQPPTASWGVMLSKGRGLMGHSPWVSIWPGLAITAVVFSFNAFGDGLRDALDPKLIGR